MARTVAQIQAAIIASIAANNNLTYQDADNITQNITNNTSKRAIWLAWTWIWATAIAVLEQLQDVYISNIEALVAQSAAATPLWIQAKMFAFQYSANNPQILQLIDTVPQYPVVNSSLLLITACSVTVDITNTVNIKVAKSDPLEALDPLLELPAAQSYINLVGVAGINYNVISLSPDRVCIYADLYYNGQYSSTITANTIAAINNWLQTLSQTNFDGSIKMSDLEATIRNVPGMNDVVLNNVSFRAYTTTPPVNPTVGATYTVQNYTITPQSRIYNPIAGYVIEEDVTNYTFLNTLNFIAQ